SSRSARPDSVPKSTPIAYPRRLRREPGSGASVLNLLHLAAVARDHHLGELLERRRVDLLVAGDAAALHDVEAVTQLEEVRVVVVDHDDRYPATRGKVLDEVDD